ncbi:MAG TPA: hypothetical protein VGQ38_15695 [Gaiellaceae bacterium]|jgi:hypothetical protein|nr:hypothetical protein [Gaiellaceae bacterium]
MTRVRLEALQWYALLGGALAWTTQHVLGYFVSTAACTDSTSHASTVQIAIAVGAVLLILAAEAAAVVVFRATSLDEEPPSGRLHFFAQAAILGNVLFLLVVVLNGVGTVYHLPCAQS